MIFLEDNEILSGMETDAIGEILNISLGSSATAVSELLGQQVNITTPEVKVMKPKEFEIKTFEPAIGVEINYIEGLSGKNILILREADVKVIVGLLLQTDFSDREFVMDEMNIGAICEVMNQMMGASSTALSQFLNRSINISPPASFEIGDEDKFKEKYLDSQENIVAIYFNLMIGDMVNSQFINVMPIPLAKELISNFGFDDSEVPPDEQPQEAPSEPVHEEAATEPAAETEPAPQPSPEPAIASPAPQPSAPRPAPAPQQQSALSHENVSPAVYQSFDGEQTQLSKGESNNLNMIMSVPLQVTVEIGRTKKRIKEILDFSAGTIVELDKQAGSQVDVYVNGKAIAKGNVVVVDDYYGVRITEVSNSNDIMKLV